MESRRLVNRRAFAALALMVGALCLAGCGGTGNTQSTSSSLADSTSAIATATATGGSVSKAQLIARADAICDMINAELLSATTRSEATAEIVRVTSKHKAIEQAGVEELSQLTPPAALASDWRSMLASRRKLAEELATLITDAKKHDSVGIQALAKAKQRERAQLLAIATRDGFNNCGRVG
jgi:hypothetical protein